MLHRLLHPTETLACQSRDMQGQEIHFTSVYNWQDVVHSLQLLEESTLLFSSLYVYAFSTFSCFFYVNITVVTFAFISLSLLNTVYQCEFKKFSIKTQRKLHLIQISTIKCQLVSWNIVQLCTGLLELLTFLILMLFCFYPGGLFFVLFLLCLTNK